MIKPDKTLLIGFLPPPINGNSLAFNILVQGFRDRLLPFYVLNLSSNAPKRVQANININRLFHSIILISHYFLKLNKSNYVYLTISISKFGFFRDFIFIWAAKITFHHITLHVHSGGYKNFYENQSAFIKQLIKITLLQAQNIIILDDCFRDHFNFLPGAPQKLKVVANGLPNNLNPPHSISYKEIGQGPINLLFLSNLIYSKGYMDVLEACRILHFERKIPFFCNFCGEFYSEKVGSVYTQAEEFHRLFIDKVSKYHLDSVINYCGPVIGDKKEEILLNSNLLILPTFYELEGQPIAIIEAMAFGIPVIATDYRGISSQVVHQVNGFLVQPHDPKKIAEYIQLIYENKDLYKNMRISAKKIFEQKFSSDAHLDKIIPIITRNN